MATNKSFSEFFESLSELKIGLDYYTDFKKVESNISKGTLMVKLSQLNHLVGKINMRKAVQEIWDENPKAFSVMGILLAVRKEQKKSAWNTDGKKMLVYDYFSSVDQIMVFLNESGLLEVLQDKHVTNLIDYVFGVEVGLDTHSRKNRIGDIMAKDIARQFDEAGIIYEQEVVSRNIPSIKKALGNDRKRFDFVIKNAEKEYLIEVNYYGSNGSKVTEIHRSYMNIAKKINSVPGYEFVWVTDGPGWEKAKEQLHEAYEEIPHVYNLATLQDFIKEIAAKSLENS